MRLALLLADTLVRGACLRAYVQKHLCVCVRAKARAQPLRARAHACAAYKHWPPDAARRAQCDNAHALRARARLEREWAAAADKADLGRGKAAGAG